ncbi:hypothetical protein HGRIS_008569 [Hohenbuehelia grisea]|uniref:Exocyst complex component EXO84 n=1 Tax=Hohenbuehelia grisea TaxID=104357 RepID=A0ABR3J8D9_9AGAR
MQSLRTRRSQAPPRKGQRAPTTKPDKNARDIRKSRVDDKIKKRMSMRYADISGPTELGVPAMPSLPVGIGGRGDGREPISRTASDRQGRDADEIAQDRGQQARARADDERMLDNESFDPDAYLKAKLANSTEAELKSLQASLRGAKDGVASDLQRNVFKNYAEFVLISKEISSLENELLELKESLSEYKSMPSLLHIPDSSSLSSSTLSTFRRSSMADLRIMYANQMQTLHAQIEGASKFAPTVPGRHVVCEADDVLALNSATYKMIGKVKFVVLDDLVLVAKRRRRNGGASAASSSANVSAGSEGKLVAERCWPLNEMLVLDTKDSPSMTNVFKIRHGKETHVYRTQTASDKKGLLSQFRQVAEELSAKKRKEREGEHERRKTVWGANNAEREKAAQPDWMAALAEKAGEASSDAKEKLERDARWVADWSDDLTIAIGLKEWERAVAHVEQGREKLPTVPALGAKLPPLTSQLVLSLLSSLSLTSNRKSTVISLISLLHRLEAGPSARSTFFQMREQVIKGLVRKIPFTGNIVGYIGELCMVWFTAIKHSADWFLASFKENEVASSFVDWAKKQLEAYAETFRMQVYTSNVDPAIVEEAKNITYTQSKKLLQEYGLDFRFLLDEQLAENPKIRDLKAIPFSFRAHSIQVPSHEDTTPVLSAFLSPGSSSAASSSAGSLTPSSAIRAPIPPRRRGSPAPSIPTQPLSAAAATSYSTGLAVPDQPTYPASATLPATSRPHTPTRSQTPTRSRTPTQSGPAPTLAPRIPLPAPSPRRTRSPAPGSSGLPTRPSQTPEPPASSFARERQARTPRPNPAPPPRSSNRPGSSAHRPPPVAVPSREGMF